MVALAFALSPVIALVVILLLVVLVLFVRRVLLLVLLILSQTLKVVLPLNGRLNQRVSTVSLNLILMSVFKTLILSLKNKHLMFLSI
ncbi:hypothetical protein CPA45_04175 [Vreelandella nigrificans]|uniref:Uncharacterized protein n=1 Tax=Vreelandella nigrificans TaxID=2042704 RepID=A0A2A4HS55_9GAMM|nr:hypothetical protein CPA45_04175 [Halomonas nigrificans]